MVPFGFPFPAACSFLQKSLLRLLSVTVPGEIKKSAKKMPTYDMALPDTYNLKQRMPRHDFFSAG